MVRQLSPSRQSSGPEGLRSRVLFRLAQILELFAEDDQLNVYAGKLEVRPPLRVTMAGDTIRN
jgi:hypothetical protein